MVPLYRRYPLGLFAQSPGTGLTATCLEFCSSLGLSDLAPEHVVQSECQLYRLAGYAEPVASLSSWLCCYPLSGMRCGAVCCGRLPTHQ